jgi:hypothetical protein
MGEANDGKNVKHLGILAHGHNKEAAYIGNTPQRHDRLNDQQNVYPIKK